MYDAVDGREGSIDVDAELSPHAAPIPTYSKGARERGRQINAAVT